jgi:hypothetical protein
MCPTPESIPVRSCTLFVRPVAGLVFWRQQGYNRTLAFRIKLARRVMALSRTVREWINWARPHLCRTETEPFRKY